MLTQIYGVTRLQWVNPFKWDRFTLSFTSISFWFPCRPPRLKNIDRSSGRSMEVTVGNVTVVITDYKPKKDRSSMEHVNQNGGPVSGSAAESIKSDSDDNNSISAKPEVNGEVHEEDVRWKPAWIYYGMWGTWQRWSYGQLRWDSENSARQMTACVFTDESWLSTKLW